jgi:hypothetical protein
MPRFAPKAISARFETLQVSSHSPSIMRKRMLVIFRTGCLGTLVSGIVDFTMGATLIPPTAPVEVCAGHPDESCAGQIAAVRQYF